MKLRMQSNSIRLRLKRGEVEKLMEIGCVEEKIILGNGRDDVFHYVLEASHAVSTPRAVLKNNGILVQIPAETVARWASGNDVGIEMVQPVGDRDRLQVLIEKDFACLNGPPEQNVDTYPNPMAGTKC